MNKEDKINIDCVLLHKDTIGRDFTEKDLEQFKNKLVTHGITGPDIGKIVEVELSRDKTMILGKIQFND